MLTAADLTAYLQTHAIPGEIIVLAEHTPTVETAAKAAGVAVDQIVKSILYLAADQPVLVVANGVWRVDYKAVAQYLGLAKKHVKMADAAAVLAHTGYPVGTVPPLGHPTRLRTLIDERVLTQPEVLAGGGAIDALMRITPAAIVAATQAETVRVLVPPAVNAEAAG